MRVLLRAASSRNAALALARRRGRPVAATTTTMASAATATPATAAPARVKGGGIFPPAPGGAAPLAPVVRDPFGAGAPADVTSAIAELNEAYDALHLEFERHFWGTKMGLAGSTPEALAAAKTAYEAWLGSRANLERVGGLLGRADASPAQRAVLAVMKRTFGTYILPSAEADALKARLNELEAELSGARNAMKLGMAKPGGGGGGGEFVAMSSVQLRNAMRVAESEEERRAAYRGVCEIGPFVAPGLAEIVKLRNQLARASGFEDYYDYKVQAAEQVGRLID